MDARTTIGGLVVLFVVLAALASTPGIGSRGPLLPRPLIPWNTEVLETGGGYTAVAVDSQGRVHAAFMGLGPWLNLTYGLNAGASWSYQQVDTNSATPALAVDSSGHPRIAYYRYTDRTVRYGYQVGTSFVTERVEQINGSYTGAISMVLDRAGQPHISYWNVLPSGTPAFIRYAWRSGMNWTVETVAVANSVNPYERASLALDSNENPRIAAAYPASTTLGYFEKNVTWSSRIIDSWPLETCCEVPSLALDSLDRPRIAYYNLTGSGLRYATYEPVADAWSFQNIHKDVSPKTSPGFASLAIDRIGHPRIAYSETDFRQLRYFSFDGAAWVEETPDTAAPAGMGNSLALDPVGAPHILYAWFDGTRSWIKHAWQVWPDTVPPTSRVLPTVPYWRNASPIRVNASASDPGVGVANVTLSYRFSADNTTWGTWGAFGTHSTPPWSWSFPFPIGEGYYEFYTTSTDQDGNVEQPPLAADAIAGYDRTPPVSSALPLVPYWYATPSVVVNATATDAVSGVSSVTLAYDYAPDNASWGPWVSSATLTSPPWSWSFSFPQGEGNYRFHTIAQDAAGNVEGNKTATEAIAGYRVPPDYAPANPSPPTPVTVGLSLSVTFTTEISNLGGDANGTATLAFFNATTPGAPFATFSVTPVLPGGTVGGFAVAWISPGISGTYAIVADVDHADVLPESNESNNVYTWIVNVVPGPITTLVVGLPSIIASGTFVTSATPLTFSVLDQSGTGIRATRYRVDGGAWVPYSANGTFTLPSEGTHLVEWSSEDNAGNVEAVANVTLHVDNTSPTTTLTIGPPTYVGSDTFVSSASVISLAAMDEGVTPGVAATEYRVDGGVWSAYATAFALATEGRHTIAYRSTDRLGNEEAPHTLAVVVDDTPPTITTDVGPPSYQGSRLYVSPAAPIALNAVDGAPIPAGLASLEYRAGGLWTPYAASFALSGLDGPVTVDYRAADRLGNAANGSLAVVLDGTPPTTTLAPVGGTYADGTAFTITSMDGGSGVARTEYAVDGGAWIPYESPFTVLVGDHTLAYRSTDHVDNREADHAIAVHIGGPPSAAGEPNSKPLVAAVFAFVLAIGGAWASRKRPWKDGAGRKEVLAAFAATSLPFVVLEASTGVVSFVTGLLSIPPIVGWGTVVDLGILIGGVALPLYRVRRVPPQR